MVNVTLVITSERCIDGNYNQHLLWRKLNETVINVFTCLPGMLLLHWEFKLTVADSLLLLMFLSRFWTFCIQSCTKTSRFLPPNQVFGCQDVNRTLILLEKHFFSPKGRFSWTLGTKMYNILIWCMRLTQNLNFSCDGPFRICFLALFLSFFSALLFMLPFWLP